MLANFIAGVFFFSCEISQWIRLFAFSAITFYYLDRAALVSQKVIRYFEWVTWTERWNKLEIPIKLEISRYRHFLRQKSEIFMAYRCKITIFGNAQIFQQIQNNRRTWHIAQSRDVDEQKKKEKTQNVNTLDISQNDA